MYRPHVGHLRGGLAFAEDGADLAVREFALDAEEQDFAVGLAQLGEGGGEGDAAQLPKGRALRLRPVGSNQGCRVAPATAVLLGRCRGAVVSAASGAVVSGPSPSPLPKVAGTSSGTNVVQA